MTMSEPLVITISHRLGKDEALSRIQGALGKVSLSFPALHVEQETWTGDRMDFWVRALGQVAAGNVRVGEQDVRLEVTLPWLLQKFAQAVQRAVEGRGRILLEKK